jgi:hypothetical protein
MSPEVSRATSSARTGARWLLAAAGVLWACADGAAARQNAPAGATLESGEFEQYLEDRGLRSVLAAHYRDELARAPGSQRAEIAEKLGALYIQLLGETTTPEQRRPLEDAGRALIALVPGAEPLELKLDLARVTYLQAERTMEDDRVRLANPEQLAEAERILRSTQQVFDAVATRAHQRAEHFERQEKNADYADGPELRAALADARRVRSLARYYSAWSGYYLAVATGDLARGAQAVNDFGWILGTGGGRPPAVDRVSKGMLKFPHVARAAVGCALCASLRGNDAEAVRWLDLIDFSDETPKELRAELPERRMAVLAAANRWSDLDVLVKRLRLPSGEKTQTLLTPRQARLAAVLALEGLARSGNERAAPVIREVAKAGLGDLVSLGENGHVLNLLTKYGSENLGNEGFLVFYARGLQTFERAREAHAAAGTPLSEPAKDDATINRYREAARVLSEAVNASDAARFRAERPGAVMKQGLALFGAGDLEQASAIFTSIIETAPTPDARRDALWYAIVALDRAVSTGKLSLSDERDRLAVLFVGRFPGTEQAAQLLLRRAGAGRVPDEEVVRTLLAVGEDSPLYIPGRREASRLLYLMYRRAPLDQRDFAIVRFADVAEPVLRSDRVTALAREDTPERRTAAEQVVLRTRQLADALLASSAPDVERATRAIGVLEEVASKLGLDLAEVKDELAYRRLQIAVARGSIDDAEREADSLRARTGPFAEAAARLMFSRATKDFSQTPRVEGSARRVMFYGQRVLERMKSADPGFKDAAHASTVNTTAEAAAALWRDEKDEDARDLAIALDKAVFDAGRHTRQTLRRLGPTAESAGNHTLALEAWRTLAIATQQGTPEWFESRYNAIRVLAMVDPARAREAMDQHKQLYPSFGPDDWAGQFSLLDSQIPKSAPSGPATPAGTSPAPGGGSNGATNDGKDGPPR